MGKDVYIFKKKANSKRDQICKSEGVRFAGCILLKDFLSNIQDDNQRSERLGRLVPSFGNYSGTRTGGEG